MFELYYSCLLYCLSLYIEPYAEINTEYYYTETYITFAIENENIGFYIEPYIYRENNYQEIDIQFSFILYF